MPEPVDLTPATPEDLAEALTYALRYSGRKRVRDSGEIMARIVAERLVEHLEQSGFVIMKRPPVMGGAALGRGHRGECTSLNPLSRGAGRRWRLNLRLTMIRHDRSRLSRAIAWARLRASRCAGVGLPSLLCAPSSRWRYA